MGSMNKVILFGNLGNAPELRQMDSGQALLKFSVATNAMWRDKDNPEEKHERTDWHRVVVWGRRAASLSKYLSRGQAVMVEGHLRQTVVQETDGKKRTFTDVVADNVQFAGGRGGLTAPSPSPALAESA